MSTEAIAHIGTIFRDTGDALETISTVQQENRIRMSSMQPALPMLDLHGLSRGEVNSSLLQKMEAKLLSRVDSLDTKGLTKLLDKCFRHISAKELQSVCLRIMQKLPTIDEKYLLHISENRELYAACPMEVKQQIWQTNQGLFGEAVSPLLDQYIAEKESLLFTTHETGKKPVSFLSLLPKTRRQNRTIQELVDMIHTAKSESLYTTLLQFLKTLFTRTKISHYCTLRADLLMSLHERESPILQKDHCHKFGWCLDACIRAGEVDGKKGRELYSFLERVSAGDTLLGDVSMLIRDPYAVNVLCRSILFCLHQLSQQGKLPRDSSELECLLRLLQLGLKALHISQTREYHEDRLDVDVMVRFFPELLSLMLDITFRGVQRQLKEDHSPLTPSKHFVTLLSSHASAMHVTCTYALQLLERKEHRSLIQLLPAIAQGYTESEDAHLPDVFLHLLVLELISQLEQIKGATLELIMREFWLPCCQSSESALLHFCRLLWGLHSKISQALLWECLEVMKPGEQLSSVAHDQYQTLMDHIKAAQDS